MESDVEASYSANCKRWARLSHYARFRGILRDWKGGPELSSQWQSLGYWKNPHLALHFRHEDYYRQLRNRRHSTRHLLAGQLDYLHRVKKILGSIPHESHDRVVLRDYKVPLYLRIHFDRASTMLLNSSQYFSLAHFASAVAVMN